MRIDVKHEKCETCKYFLQHYVISNSGFTKTCCGHCINRRLYESRARNKYALQANCEFWESDADKKVERIQNIKEALKSMQEHLSEMISILKDDSE